MLRLLCTLVLAAGLVSAQPLPLDGIAHVGFRTSNLERSRAYYTNLLGFQQGFELKNAAGEVTSAFFKMNDEQYVEITPGLAAGEPVLFTHVAFETQDIEAVRRLLAARGISAPAVGNGNGGNLTFSIQDPEKHRVEFVQYRETSLAAQGRGKFLDTRRLASHLQHVGVVIPSDRVEAALHFYHDQLGLEEVWRYAPGGELRLIKLATSGKRRDIIELMITPAGKTPTRAQYGSMYHVNFEVPEITPAYRQLLDRGAPATAGLKPVVNAENIWAINLLDPDGTRTEIQDLRKVPVMRLGLVGLEHGHVSGFFNQVPGPL